MALDFDAKSELQFAAIDQWMGTPEFTKLIKDEFPEDAAEWLDPITRRQMLTLMGASAALAGAVGCNPSLRPASGKKAIPYVKKPEAITPGVPLFFPSAITLGGYALGVLVKSHEGRPIKIEGNPSHPASLGATDVYAQGAVLGLYDPDRSKEVTYRGSMTTWDKAKDALMKLVEAQKAKAGAGLRILSEASTSPTIAALVAELRAATTANGTGLSQAKWIQYEPVSRDNVYEGAKLAFNQYVTPNYKLDQADVILSLDGDFLAAGPGGVRYARDSMSRRKVRLGNHGKKDGVSLAKMSRIYAVESGPGTAGHVADHRLPMKPSEIESFVRALAKELKVENTSEAGPLPERAKLWLTPLAADLTKAKGKAIVVPGEHLSKTAQALVHAINAKLDAVGHTVVYTKPAQTGFDGSDAADVANSVNSLKTLVADMKAGTVDALIILGGNPVFSAPADLDFLGGLLAMDKGKKARVHLGLYQDETAVQCDWHINEVHGLETWGDARAYDGTASLIQPLIAPVHGGKSAIEVLSVLVGKPGDTLGPVKATWEKLQADKKVGFDEFWHKSLEQGLIDGTAFEPVKVEVNIAALAKIPAPASVKDEIEIAFRADPTIYDGRFVNNGWLQELPKPGTRLTWDNAAIVSPATAAKLKCTINYAWTGGEHGNTIAQMVDVKVGERSLKLPVFIHPGHADDVITLYMGYGRNRCGKVGEGSGFNAYAIRTTDKMWVAAVKPEQITKTGEEYHLACTQGQHAMEGRRPARHGTVAEALAERKEVPHGDHKHLEFPNAFDFADNPPAAAAEKGLMRALLPGTPEERERLEEDWGSKGKRRAAGYVNNVKKHEDGDGDHHDHEHAHDTRLMPLTLINDHENNKLYRRWGMAIDLNSCTGCSACVVACVAENNIAIVGKKEVMRGRVMHWIRIDRYFAVPAEKGGTEKATPDERWEALRNSTYDVTAHVQPVNCQQCEKAPCETVCPVGATVHSADGLNDMAYNRCVGTRYCANNCPYKVRRFNFIQYADYAQGTSMSLVNNPEVTVRTRGVMEKCTYCVQRIRNAEMEAEREHNTAGRPMVSTPLGVRPLILDGEVKTACQTACPSGAIAFGDLNYDQYTRVQKVGEKYETIGGPLGFSEVSRWKLEPTHYGLLAELNTMPRTSYLAAVKNPNPDLVKLLPATKEGSHS